MLLADLAAADGLVLGAILVIGWSDDGRMAGARNGDPSLDLLQGTERAHGRRDKG